MKSVYKSADGQRAVREQYLEFLNRWPVPNQQLHVPTRAGDTFVIISGAENAPPLVLLHGSMANSAMWMPHIPAWANHFRIYAVDIIGDAGLSAPSRPSFASDAHALWLDDVLDALGINRASMAGVSLGGWLVLDYAIRRSSRVESLVVLCPPGLGRQKLGVAVKTIPLQLLGTWGRRKARELVLGRIPQSLPPEARYFADFFALIQKNFCTRMVKFPIFTDQELQKLHIPLMAIIGGKDVLIDSEGTKRRLATHIPHAELRYLPDTGHFIPGQTDAILDFLLRTVVAF